MEPLGLVQFLQSLMNLSTPAEDKKADVFEEETAPATPKNTVAEPPQEDPLFSSSQDTALSFLLRHEELAKRTRRKK